MATTTKRKWLEEGLTLLAKSGAGALTIEMLTSRLGVTKGSFYHHFQHFQDYKEHLLSFYEDERTLQVIESAEQPEEVKHIRKESYYAREKLFSCSEPARDSAIAGQCRLYRCQDSDWDC